MSRSGSGNAQTSAARPRVGEIGRDKSVGRRLRVGEVDESHVWAHVFHVRARADTSDSWRHSVTGTGQDSELQFFCRFVALPLLTHLADHQDARLHRISPGWTTGSHHKP